MLSPQQMQLLQAVDRSGSITQAAKDVGISYKNAWDKINLLNQLLPQPLVAGNAGGAKGGGTRLTDTGRQLVQGYVLLQAEHQQYLEQLSLQLGMVETQLTPLTQIQSRLKNQFRGQLTAINWGEDDAELHIQLVNNITLIAVLPTSTMNRLGLAEGDKVLAMVKPASVFLSPQQALLTSARNHFTGSISALHPGSVNTQVSVDIGVDNPLMVSVTNASVTKLGLAEGASISAFFKAPAVVVIPA